MLTVITLVLFILVSIFLIYISLKFYKKICNPLLFCTAGLAFSTVFACYNKQLSDDQMSSAILWITVGMFCLEISFLVAQFLTSGKANFNTQRNMLTAKCYNKQFTNKLINICCVLALLSLILNLIEVLKVSHGFLNIFTNSTYVRIMYLQRSSSLFVLLFGNVITINLLMLLCLFPIAIELKCNLVYPKMMFVLGLRAFTSIITMSKQLFLVTCVILISSYLIVLPNKKREITFLKRNMKWFVTIGIALFVVIAYQRNYVGTRYDSYFDSVVGTIYSYVSIPVVSFAVLISQTNPVLLYGRQCFRPIINILARLGFGSTISIIQEQISENVGNVFTLFGNMFNDFGFIGIIFLSIFFGLLMGSIYKVRTRNKLHVIVINSIINMIMFFGFFDFMLIQTVYILIMVYAVLFEKVLASKLYQTQIQEK